MGGAKSKMKSTCLGTGAAAHSAWRERVVPAQKREMGAWEGACLPLGFQTSTVGLGRMSPEQGAGSRTPTSPVPGMGPLSDVLKERDLKMRPRRYPPVSEALRSVH